MILNRYYMTQLERASHFNDISNLLIDSGDCRGALVAIKKSSNLYREVAAAFPDLVNRALGMTLCKMARYLRDEGRGKEAVDAAQEAVDVIRAQAEIEPEELIPDLAAALCDLTLHVAHTYPKQKERAVAACQETVSLYRELAAKNPEEYKKDLALALHNMSGRFYVMGEGKKAVSAETESLAIYKELAETRPAAFNHMVADCLFNMSTFLAGIGRQEESLAPIQEATEMHRAMAIVDPDFDEDLALSLYMLSICLSEGGKGNEALVALQERVEIGRKLASKNPTEFTPKLASYLQDFAIFLCNTKGGEEGARTAINEAVEIYQRLFKQDPVKYRPALQKALNFLKEMGPKNSTDIAMEYAS